ncbi:aminopeptidase N [Topomyia yanbarensis]|uniref:aminopeptidase N n=1 Tax=Topomyia yanbarensis TaxID=2498891 RepID=UPI00273B94A2|nr:aminopeptidase N [Topomyia yanbarensis]XP_058833113.1 aminopeptidase N [Topomyia yanbarensis]XP_058833120.1 aminopeptidase N [Topomyia yanbarensis]
MTATNPILACAVFGLATLVALTCCASVSVTETTYTNYRLPKALRPEHYSLQVLTHLGDERGFLFTGRVLIRMICDEDVTNVTLHSKNLTIAEKDVKLTELSPGEPKPIEIKRVQYITDNDYVVFHASEHMKKGKQYEISIPFEGPLGTGLLGYYRSSYVDQRTQKKIWLSVTQFEPTHARNAFPCFDEPAMKATFDVSLGHHKQYTALSNMPINRTEPMTSTNADWVLDHFDTTVPMSTYLVAYSVNDFEYREASTKMDGDVVFKIWARRDAIDQTDYARDVGPRVTRFYEEYFAEKFPLPKIDMIAIPDFSAGAMENWGLITYRETALLYHPNISTASNKHRVASVIAHELAHQWFGNLVTMKWWTDLWLNEGFATYVASLGVEYLHPEWHSLEEESVDNTLGIFKFDALISSHPVSVEIGHPNQISQIFDAISYEKGSTVIRMMHLFLGEETFRNGVRRYLKRHKYANAEQNDLWAALTEEARENGVLPKEVDVKTVMESWTLQTGYPVIEVTRDYETGTADITQVRFLSDREQQQNFTDYCWWIPLTYVSSENPDFEHTRARDWMMCGANDLRKEPVKMLDDLPGKDDWVMFNVQLAGLYKVKYDKANYRLIVKQLNSGKYNVISLANRAQLIDDAMDLAWSGEQEYGIAFAMMNYLRQETEYIPWKSALSNFNTINRLLKRTPIYGVFRSYIQFIIEPIYERLQIFSEDRVVSERLDSTKQLVQIAAWACKFDVGDCVQRSVALFASWMAVEDPDSSNPVPRDLRSVVYCNAIRNGKETEWNFLWKRYLNSNVGSEKVMIIGSLSCTREIWLVERFLQWSLNSTSGVRKQDTTILFSGVAKSDVGYHLAKSFFVDNVQQIYSYLWPDTSRLSRYLKPLAEEMSTAKELEELKDLIDSKQAVFEKATQGVKQALEMVEINLQWKSTSYHQMARYLPQLTYRTTSLDVTELI